jgi:hypothetical protein
MGRRDGGGGVRKSVRGQQRVGRPPLPPKPPPSRSLSNLLLQEAALSHLRDPLPGNHRAAAPQQHIGAHQLAPQQALQRLVVCRLFVGCLLFVGCFGWLPVGLCWFCHPLPSSDTRAAPPPPPNININITSTPPRSVPGTRPPRRRPGRQGRPRRLFKGTRGAGGGGEKGGVRGCVGVRRPVHYHLFINYSTQPMQGTTQTIASTCKKAKPTRLVQLLRGQQLPEPPLQLPPLHPHVRLVWGSGSSGSSGAARVD